MVRGNGENDVEEIILARNMGARPQSRLTEGFPFICILCEVTNSQTPDIHRRRILDIYLRGQDGCNEGHEAKREDDRDEGNLEIVPILFLVTFGDSKIRVDVHNHVDVDEEHYVERRRRKHMNRWRI